MSQENVDLVRRFYEPATSKAEMLSAMPRIMELCHPGVEWTTREDGQTYRARGGVREVLERWLESFDEYSFDAQRIARRWGNWRMPTLWELLSRTGGLLSGDPPFEPPPPPFLRKLRWGRCARGIVPSLDPDARHPCVLIADDAGRVDPHRHRR